MPILNNGDLLDGAKKWPGTNPFPAKPVDDWSADSQFNGIIPFGYGLARGTGEGVTLPSSASSVFEGFAVATETIEKRDGYSVNADGLLGYPDDHRVTVRRDGPIVVRTVQAVAKGDPVWVIHTPQSGQRAGQCRKDIDTNRAIRAGRYEFAEAAPANSNVAIHQI